MPKPNQIWMIPLLMLGLLSVPLAWSAEDEVDWSALDEQGQYGIQTPDQFGLQQQQQQQQQMQAAGPAHPILSRMFRPFTKHVRPPILQPKKFPKEAARETKPLPDPLVRLGSGVQFNGTLVLPGYYLLHLEPTADNQPPLLSLVQHQDILLTLPATTASVAPATPEPVQPAPLPEPPDKSHASKKKASKADKDALPTPKAPTQPDATARVEYAENGESLYLVYKKGDQEYITVALPIVTHWDQSWEEKDD